MAAAYLQYYEQMNFTIAHKRTAKTSIKIQAWLNNQDMYMLYLLRFR